MTTLDLPPAAAPAVSARRALPFTAWRFFGFSATLAMLLATVVALWAGGLNLGLDFTGGVAVQASRATPFDVAQLRGALAARGLEGAVVQLGDRGATVYIRAQLLPEAPSPTAENSAARRTVDAIRASLGAEARVEKSETVGPKASARLLQSGVVATLLAIGAIAVYVWVRFEAKFGWAALLTTLHDVVVLLGFYAVAGLSFDLSSIAALLAIAGYSINDTVIVFDRIRETLGRFPSLPIDEVIDRSITDTLRRTLATSGTTLMTSLSIMIAGGPVLFGFGAAISFGILAGTFSSIFVAAPLLRYLPGALPGRTAPEAGSPAGLGAD